MFSKMSVWAFNHLTPAVPARGRFYYHLSEIGKGLISSLLLLRRKGDVRASDFLKKIEPLETHFEGLFLLQKEVTSFRKKYEDLIKELREKYVYGNKDTRTGLDSNDRERYQIELTKLLECVFSLITTSSLMMDLEEKYLLNPKDFKIEVIPFPQSLKVKIGKSEQDLDLNETFIIGRTDDDYIGIREFPSTMELKKLVDMAGNDEQIKYFQVKYKSKERLERQDPFKPTASRIHVIIFYDKNSSRFWMIDISRSETTIEIDGYRFTSIGYRATWNPYPSLIPLGKINKLWIHPQLKRSGPCVEITI
ncbi:MAG: hypothetical protein FGF51_04585 [Candidatus Brockarchaeota archaeon]|nr:hypothetical protein [Candidatus Brockarchaeota archaeon]